MIRNLLLYFLIAPLTVACSSIVFFSDLLLPQSNMKFSASRFWFAFIMKILNVRIKILGIENIEHDVRYVIICNHMSALDIPALCLGLPISLSFMAKKELFKIPFFGWVLKILGHIPINRKYPRDALEQIEEFTKNQKFKNHSIIFFPEGTRSLDGQVASFKRGGFNFANKIDLPVLPVSIKGSFRLIKKGDLFAKSGEIDLIIHKSLKQKDYKNQAEFIETVRNVIVSCL